MRLLAPRSPQVDNMWLGSSHCIGTPGSVSFRNGGPVRLDGNTAGGTDPQGMGARIYQLARRARR